MANNVSRVARAFFNYETLTPFLVGSIALGVLVNAIYQVLTNWFGTTTPVVVAIALGSLSSLLAAMWAFTRVVKQMRLDPAENFRTRKPRQQRGLILMVSRLDPCVKAIEFHQPVLERCWLICSGRTLDMAEGLRQRFPEICCAEPHFINDIYDPLEFRACVDKIYRSLPDGWSEFEVIADYVGMTAHGSVGMSLACIAGRRPLQYTPARFDEELKAVEALEPIEIVLEPAQSPAQPSLSKVVQ